MSSPFVAGSWFDPEPGHTGVLGMTLEQLADEIRYALRHNLRGDCRGCDAGQALEEILRRIDAATGNG